MSQIYGFYEILGLNYNASNDDIKKVSKKIFNNLSFFTKGYCLSSRLTEKLQLNHIPTKS